MSMFNIAKVWLYLSLVIATQPVWARDYVLCDQYCGVVDEHGKPRFERVFDHLMPFVGDFSLFKNEGQPWGLIDRSGQARYEFPPTEEHNEPEAWFAGTWLSTISIHERYTLHAPSGEMLLRDVHPVNRATDSSKTGSMPYVYKTAQGTAGKYYEIYDMQGQLKLILASRPEYAEQTMMPAQDYATGLWGYLDRDFNWTVLPQYTLACKFIIGSAAVKNVIGWTLINQQRKRLNAFEFIDQYQKTDPCYSFEKASFGVRSVSNQRYYLQYRDGRAIQLPFGTMLSSSDHISPDLIEVYQKIQGEPRGVVRLDGTWVIPLGKLNFSILGSNSIRFKDPQGQYGLLDGHGQLIAAAQYQYILPLGNHPDLFIVTQNHLHGVLSRKSGLIIPIQYAEIETARPGMVLAKNSKTRLYQLLTEEGKALEFPPVEFMQWTMPDGVRRIILRDKREGFVNAVGQFEPIPKQQAIEVPTEYDELGLAAVGDTLLSWQGEGIATFASVWPQYQYKSQEVFGVDELWLDPCIIDNPVEYSEGQGDRKPAWCQQAALRAAVKKTMTTFYQWMTVQNAPSLERQKKQFLAELAVANADLIAICQLWQTRLNSRKVQPLHPIKKLQGTVPKALQQRLMVLISGAEADYVSEQVDFNAWYWADLNQDGQREVIFSTPIDGGRATKFYIFAKSHSAMWQLMAQPYSFDHVISHGAKPARWPDLATMSIFQNGRGQSELWRYSKGKYSVMRSCVLYLGDEVDMLTFCPETQKDSGAPTK